MKKQLEAVNFAISKKKDEVDREVENLKITINHLKEKNSKKEQHVHPLIAEDLIEQIRRLQMKIEEKESKNRYFEELVEEMKSGTTYEEILERKQKEEEEKTKKEEEEERKAEPELVY